MIRAIILATAAATLAGCAGHNPCEAIAITDYPPETQQRIAAEVAVAGPNTAWPQAIYDYRHLREDVRACQATKKE